MKDWREGSFATLSCQDMSADVVDIGIGVGIGANVEVVS